MKLKTKLSAIFWGGTALFLGSSYMAHKALLDRTFETPKFLKETFYTKKKSTKDYSGDERVLWFNEQTFEDYELINSEGNKIKAHFLKSETPSDIYVLCLPGYRASAKKQFRFISRFYHDSNINLLLVDHQASGDSEGRYISFGEKEYADALLWLHFLTEKFGKEIKIFIHGISMGAATANIMCADASLPEQVKFLISDCSFTEQWKLFTYSLKQAHWPVFPLLEGVDKINSVLAGFSFKDAHKPVEAARNINIPVLFIHGKRDNFVPWQMANELFENCNSKNKELWFIENASHSASYLKEPEIYQEKIIERINDYIK